MEEGGQRRRRRGRGGRWDGTEGSGSPPAPAQYQRPASAPFASCTSHPARTTVPSAGAVSCTLGQRDWWRVVEGAGAPVRSLGVFAMDFCKWEAGDECEPGVTFGVARGSALERRRVPPPLQGHCHRSFSCWRAAKRRAACGTQICGTQLTFLLRALCYLWLFFHILCKLPLPFLSCRFPAGVWTTTAPSLPPASGLATTTTFSASVLPPLAPRPSSSSPRFTCCGRGWRRRRLRRRRRRRRRRRCRRPTPTVCSLPPPWAPSWSCRWAPSSRGTACCCGGAG